MPEEATKEETVNWRTRKNLIYGSKIEIDGKIYREERRKIDDLDGNGQEEIIITLSSEDYSKGYVYIFTILDEKGNYKEIGRAECGKYLMLSGIEDITNNGIKEIFLSSIERGGHAGQKFFKILNIDFDTQELSWIKFQDKEGKKNIIFEEWGYREVCTFQKYIFNKDFDKNGKKEIIGLSGMPCEVDMPCPCLSFCEPECKKFKGKDPYDTEWQNCVEECNKKYKEEIEGKGICEKCELSIYEWNGLIFLYNKELSEMGKNKVDVREFPLVGCKSCIWDE